MTNQSRNSGPLEIFTAYGMLLLVTCYLTWQYVSPHFPIGMLLAQFLV